MPRVLYGLLQFESQASGKRFRRFLLSAYRLHLCRCVLLNMKRQNEPEPEPVPSHVLKRAKAEVWEWNSVSKRFLSMDTMRPIRTEEGVQTPEVSFSSSDSCETLVLPGPHDDDPSTAASVVDLPAPATERETWWRDHVARLGAVDAKLIQILQEMRHLGPRVETVCEEVASLHQQMIQRLNSMPEECGDVNSEEAEGSERGA